jgi:2-polyprenyl-3-methyl-5-hydroxy-6-metoxy-1,4-benzoquinol methylase
MEDTLVSQQDFWQEHYCNQHFKKADVGIAKSMDYPNDRLQVHTYAQILESLGQLKDKSLLDAGCGWGVLSLLASFLGASPVGVDFVPATVEALRRLHPGIRWEVANFDDPTQLAPLGLFDRVAAVEVLQYVAFGSTVAKLWDLVAPGGRLVGCVPNSLCPFVRGVRQRLNHWIPVAPDEISKAASTLPACSALYMKGLTYLEDQTFLPYATSDWSPEIHGTPNRIVFAMLRA